MLKYFSNTKNLKKKNVGLVTTLDNYCDFNKYINTQINDNS